MLESTKGTKCWKALEQARLGRPLGQARLGRPLGQATGNDTKGRLRVMTPRAGYGYTHQGQATGIHHRAGYGYTPQSRLRPDHTEQATARPH